MDKTTQRKILKSILILRKDQIKAIESLADPLRNNVRMIEDTILGKQSLSNLLLDNERVSKYLKSIVEVKKK